ncbi:hypothetical protein FOF52_10770 [Thermobifida alba]|uniref:Lipoprotein n=1 Tax=Thermobifida alba TaxID=53522 RepID=A0ABY4L135_THEAE|nr:DUF6406 domain-containing protein [Thermobifida alba]UPT21382.1 hypothetical protein FOF52_10770 [Thermobifida alba]
MSLFDVRTVLRVFLAAAVGAALAACSAQGEQPPADTVAVQSPAPVLGDYDDRIQLVEGSPHTLAAEDGGSVVLEVTGHDEAEPSVVVRVAPEDGEAEEWTVTLGDLIDVAGATWRVSELGFSDSMPGSVTLTRAE